METGGVFFLAGFHFSVSFAPGCKSKIPRSGA
jgi:hypothetical protein